ncbi:MAG: hypothetical protein LUD78_05790, partial [Clostridiales bacterium]|nr:hypothetical protein [Clostridiales bacterium]
HRIGSDVQSNPHGNTPFIGEWLTAAVKGQRPDSFGGNLHQELTTEYHRILQKATKSVSRPETGQPTLVLCDG